MDDLQKEALKAHQELHSVRQGIGALGVKLRRTKPGSKRHQAYWDALTRLESEAEKLSSTVVLFIRTGHP